jgi:hypothetical protein
MGEGYGVQSILSGSSSLKPASTLNEPPTGPKWSFELYPINWSELRNDRGALWENYIVNECLKQQRHTG